MANEPFDTATRFKYKITVETTMGTIHEHVIDGAPDEFVEAMNAHTENLLNELGSSATGALIVQNPLVVYNSKQIVSVSYEFEGPPGAEQQLMSTTGFQGVKWASV